MIGMITWAALARYCASSVGGELYTVLSQDWVNQATQKAPSGTFSQLVAYFDSIGGAVTPPAVVAPPPPPVTPPVTPTVAPAAFVTDVNKYVSDVTAALARIQDSTATLNTQLNDALLTKNQRAALAMLNAVTKAAGLIARGVSQ
jgi:hypothetical protein